MSKIPEIQFYFYVLFIHHQRNFTSSVFASNVHPFILMLTEDALIIEKQVCYNRASHQWK